MTSLILAVLTADVGSSFSIYYQPQVEKDPWDNSEYYDISILASDFFSNDFFAICNMYNVHNFYFDFTENADKYNMGGAIAIQFGYTWGDGEGEQATAHFLNDNLTCVVLSDGWINLEFRSDFYNLGGRGFEGMELGTLYFGNVRFIEYDYGAVDDSGLFNNLEIPFLDLSVFEYYYSGRQKVASDISVGRGLLNGARIDILDLGGLYFDAQACDYLSPYGNVNKTLVISDVYSTEGFKWRISNSGDQYICELADSGEAICDGNSAIELFPLTLDGVNIIGTLYMNVSGQLLSYQTVQLGPSIINVYDRWYEKGRYITEEGNVLTENYTVVMAPDDSYTVFQFAPGARDDYQSLSGKAQYVHSSRYNYSQPESRMSVYFCTQQEAQTWYCISNRPYYHIEIDY